jgi:hypothetical protein
LRRELEDVKADRLAIYRMTLPGSQRWAFHEEAKVLAISPELDPTTEAELLAQVEPLKLTACDVCGAPMYVGRRCAMH